MHKKKYMTFALRPAPPHEIGKIPHHLGKILCRNAKFSVTLQQR